MFVLNTTLSDNYKSWSQKARVMTEPWAIRNTFCPNCWSLKIEKYINNKPVADFYCDECKEDYELKSWKIEKFSNIVMDWSYKTMIERLESNTSPNFFVLQYNKKLEVLNYIAIPKYFVRHEDIVPRKTWIKWRPNYIMCNISMKWIPESWKIFYIRNWEKINKKEVLYEWNKTIFLKEDKNIDSKGWILDIMKCIEMLHKKDFTLQEIYNFEPILKQKYPNNNFIKDKIRQQLQILRDKWYLEFVDSGKYRLV